jgi:hypothetical protein
MPSFTRRLRQETPGWIRDGVVTAQQADAILARYPESGHWFQRPIAIFSILGGALVILAVALVIAHNWQEIPRWAKLAGLLALLLGAYTGGLVIRARGYGLVGEGLFVLGGGLFLLGIALIGQLYNLAGRESDAVLLWWALLMPAAYALPSIALVVLAWCGASVWFCMFVLDRTTWLGRDVYSNATLGAVAFAAAGVLVWVLGSLHGDGEFRRAGRLIEQLGLLTILVALVPLGFLKQFGRLGGLRTHHALAGGGPGPAGAGGGGRRRRVAPATPGSPDHPRGARRLASARDRLPAGGDAEARPADTRIRLPHARLDELGDPPSRGTGAHPVRRPLGSLGVDQLGRDLDRR